MYWDEGWFFMYPIYIKVENAIIFNVKGDF